MIEVRTLGDFSLTICGRPVPRWRAGGARSLLQFLLLRPGVMVSTETLCEALWPETAAPANARTSLKVAVHTLRRIITEHLPAERSPLWLATCPEGYRLEVCGLLADFQRFDELIDRAHRADARESTAEAVDSYRAAVEVYAGHFLSGVDADWARVHREWLRGRYLYALHQLCRAGLTAGDHLAVMRWSRLMIDAEPFHEAAYRALILTHAKLGQLSQVRRWYRVCADRLYDELGVSPSAETRRIYRLATQRAVEHQSR